MEVNIKQAIKALFSKPSFDMIYLEAVANSLDAGASNISITVELSKQKDLQNLSLTIEDDGCGFDKIHFDRFCHLFQAEEDSHKGLGRLVYLCYFENVKIESVYNNISLRIFNFNDSFDNKSEERTIPKRNNGSKLYMTGFLNKQLHRNESIRPDYIKDLLIDNFYLRLYKLKQQHKNIIITVNSVIEQGKFNAVINNSEIPNFSKKELENTDNLTLFDKMELYYNITEVETGKSPKVLTAYAIDDRCFKEDVISKENFPSNYNLTFFLLSKSLQGKTDVTRQDLDLTENDRKKLLKNFRKGIREVIDEQLPKITERNKKTMANLSEKYPHLQGYFKSYDIGFSSREDILKDAQAKFFKDQRDILEATNLDEKEYEKSLEISSRTLAQYILFRQCVINKLKKLNPIDKEEKLHNILIPKGNIFNSGTFIDNIYQNNVWVIDDKFMTYSTILSEEEMSKVITYITDGDTSDNDDDRPDITILLNGNPNDKEDSKLDVVVVELKRLGISAEQNSIVEFQLDTRTQKLAKYFGNRIQRMWFYGIVDFDDRYILHLINNQFLPLYSNGTIYYRSKAITSDLSFNYRVIQNAFILDFKALVEDADARDSTFLKILKNEFKKS